MPSDCSGAVLETVRPHAFYLPAFPRQPSHSQVLSHTIRSSTSQQSLRLEQPTPALTCTPRAAQPHRGTSPAASSQQPQQAPLLAPPSHQQVPAQEPRGSARTRGSQTAQLQAQVSMLCSNHWKLMILISPLKLDLLIFPEPPFSNLCILQQKVITKKSKS